MRPTLLVLPGLDGTDVFFRPFLEALPASVQASFVDLPADGAYRYEELVDVVRRRIADMPPLYVFASSFSGPLAIMLAEAEPQKVRGLILAATFVRSPRPRLGWLRFAMVTPIIWAVRAARRMPVWLLTPRTDPIRLAKAETWSRVPARALAARARAIIGVDVRDACGRARSPCCASRTRTTRSSVASTSRRSSASAQPPSWCGSLEAIWACTNTLIAWPRRSFASSAG